MHIPLDSRKAITQFLFLEDEPRQVDLSFVLGSPSISSIVPAVNLYQSGMTKKIVISGHGPRPNSLPEWKIYQDYAIAHGVLEQDILVETKATNTLENFVFSFDLIEEKIGWGAIKTVALSAKPFHMRRALMTARQHWPSHISYVMRPSNAPDDPPASTWWQTEGGRQFVLGELRAIGTYGLAGDLGDF